MAAVLIQFQALLHFIWSAWLADTCFDQIPLRGVSCELWALRPGMTVAARKKMWPELGPASPAHGAVSLSVLLGTSHRQHVTQTLSQYQVTSVGICPVEPLMTTPVVSDLCWWPGWTPGAGAMSPVTRLVTRWWRVWCWPSWSPPAPTSSSSLSTGPISCTPASQGILISSSVSDHYPWHPTLQEQLGLAADVPPPSPGRGQHRLRLQPRGRDPDHLLPHLPHPAPLLLPGVLLHAGAPHLHPLSTQRSLQTL